MFNKKEIELKPCKFSAEEIKKLRIERRTKFPFLQEPKPTEEQR